MPRAVRDQGADGIGAVGAVRPRAEAVQDVILAVEGEDRPAALAVDVLVVAAALGGHAIERSVRVHGQPHAGILAVGAIALRAEAVQDALLSIGRELVEDAARLAGDTSGVLRRGAVEVARGIADDAVGERLAAIALRAEIVK